MRFSPGNHYDRECLMTAITGRCTPPLAHQALTAANVLRVLHGGPDVLAASRATTVAGKFPAQSVAKFLGLNVETACTGDCNQGRACKCRPAAEMAVVGDDIPKPARRSRWSRLLRNMRRFLMSPRAW